MYFIHGTNISCGREEFNIEDELKKIQGIVMINYKYYVVGNKLLFANITNTHVILAYFDIKTKKLITFTTHKLAIDDICILRSRISITPEDIIFTIFTRLEARPVIITIALCCLSKVFRNKLTKQNEILSAESIALSGGKIHGNIEFRGNNCKKILVDECKDKWRLEFLKLYDGVYLFAVNSINMVVKCIIYFNFNGEVSFGIRVRDIDYYYECSSSNFVHLLLNLNSGKHVTMDRYQLVMSCDSRYKAIECVACHGEQ